MCGIVGIVDPRLTLSTERLAELCERMCRKMAHRGPDDQGTWVAPGGGCALGHRRLSIIDPGSGGHQPMVAPSGSALSFNGEIYNFPELRLGLEARGWEFRTRTDSEVLLAGLDLDGPEFTARLDGMYAFAHWDGLARRLLLARDRFGEKPLYLYRSGGLLAFASEMHVFAELPDFDDRVEVEAIAHYMAFQYVPAPGAFYRACAKLEPGRVVRIEDDLSLTELGRSGFTTAAERGPTRRPGELADELEEILIRTVKSRLVSDVPLGAFLSGGVDSSTVAAIVTRRLNRPLRTYSIGFADTPDSEHEAARAMAAYLGTEHVDEIVAPSALADMVELIGSALDEPNGDSSCLPTWLLSRLARRDITVALSGDGGDEMFGGYGRYFSTLNDRRRFEAGEDGFAAWRPGAAYYSTRLLLCPERDVSLLTGSVPDSLTALLGGLRGRMDADPRALLNRLREADARDYLPGAVLAKVDRMSMRHSLEVRSPLLGNAVADFAQTLGEGDCWDGGAGKRVLKEVARRFIPAEWLDRPKMGFGLPMRSWAEGDALAVTRAMLAPGENRLSAWLGQDNLDRFLATQAARPLLYQLWALMVLESWLRSHPARPA
jgi:asparagine synthase (glutamine-hydrolysing)